jgi:MFS family permease
LRAAVAAVWAVIVCTFFVQAGNGLQTNLIGLRANSVFALAVIGPMMAAYYIGYSVAPLAGRAVIGRIGHVRAVVLCMLVAAAVVVLHPFAVSAPAWTVFRAVSGFALSLSYVAVESWINDRVGNALRGRVFSIYMFAQMAGMTLSQGLTSLGDARSVSLYAVAAVLFLLAVVPIVLSQASAPSGAPPKPLGLLTLFRLSPLGAGATVLAGLSWAAMFTFGPVYAARIGFGVTGVALFMGLAMAVGGALQVPLGWLSDIAGRRPVIGGMFGAGLAAGLFGILAQGETMNLIAAALAGGCVFPIYAVSAATVNDRVSQETRVAAAAGLVLLFGIGSFFGPLICGWAMAAVGLPGFFGVLTAAMGAGVALTLVSKAGVSSSGAKSGLG